MNLSDTEFEDAKEKVNKALYKKWEENEQINGKLQELSENTTASPQEIERERQKLL
jgi:hypothetical protein